MNSINVYELVHLALKLSIREVLEGKDTSTCKIHAIKTVRSITGCCLGVAKGAVEELMGTLYAPDGDRAKAYNDKWNHHIYVEAKKVPLEADEADGLYRAGPVNGHYSHAYTGRDIVATAKRLAAEHPGTVVDIWQRRASLTADVKVSFD